MRVCFILGNLTADDNSMREELFFSHCALPILNNISSKYFTAEQEQVPCVSSHMIFNQSDFSLGIT